MKADTSSVTAEDMAGHRAFEMLRPEDQRVCQDPYAVYFVSDQCRKTLKSPFLAWFRQWMIQKVHPGGADAVIVRARFIDDHIEASVEKGLEQLVILGAGYDCRPYRMDALKTGVSIFEVDHSSTQNRKIETLTRILGRLPDHVTFVPYRINGTGLKQVLAGRGYDPLKKTLFIMEGLVMYLPMAVFRQTLGFVARYAGPGSAIVFDFLPPGIDDGTIRLKVGQTLHNYAKKRGEPFQWGMDRFEMEAFLLENGFSEVECIPAQDCRRQYFNGANKKRKISKLFSFARARVKPE